MNIIKLINKEENKNWDMCIPVKQLILSNTHCFIDRNWTGSKHEPNCYKGICLYLKGPDSEEYETMLAISDDGFEYIGEGSHNHKETTKITIEEGIVELVMNRDYLRLLQHNNIYKNYYKRYKNGIIYQKFSITLEKEKKIIYPIPLPNKLYSVNILNTLSCIIKDMTKESCVIQPSCPNIEVIVEVIGY